MAYLVLVSASVATGIVLSHFIFAAVSEISVHRN